MKLLEKYSIQKTDDIDREKFNLIWDMFYHDGYEKFREIDQDEYWEEFCGNDCYIEASDIPDKFYFSTYNDKQIMYKPISSELLEIFLLRYSIQVDRINMGERFSIKGEMCYFYPNFFIVAERIENSRLFTLLGIENKKKFTKHILGYCPNGEFPECANYEELKKLFLAMLDYAIEPFAYLEEGEEKSGIRTSSELFPVGTVVQLSEIGLSAYKSQLEGEENKGSVIGIDEDSDFYYLVKWVGGHSNCYKKQDIELYIEDEKVLKESLNVSDLITGEIYVASEGQSLYIFKENFKGFLRVHSDSIGKHAFVCTDGYKYRKATKFEEKWYKWCMRNNTFVNPEKLFEEACKKYPVGTKFKVAHNSDNVRTVESHEKGKEWCVINDSLYDLHINLKTNDGEDCEEASVYTYLHGWAKAVNPEVVVPDTQEETSMFKKDSYIICLEDNGCSFLENYCFKQEENYDYLRPYLDCKGHDNNGWGKIKYHSTNWRYATSDEIFAYEQLGKPYDVTTLLQTSEEKVEVDPNVFPKGSYVVLLSTCDGDPRIWGNSIPVNYIYQLSRDSNSRCFFMAKDTRGNVNNGWSVDEESTFDSKLKLRAATTEEIALYQKHDGPVSIFDISKPLSGEENVQMGHYPFIQCFGKFLSEDRDSNDTLNFYNNFYTNSGKGMYGLKKTCSITRENEVNLVILEPGCYYETNYGQFLLRENGVADFVNGDRKSIFDLSGVKYCRKTEIHKIYPITPSEAFLPTPTIMEVVPKENYFPEVREIKL